MGEVSNRGGHPAGGSEARQQTDAQRADLGLRGLQRSGVGERLCELPSGGQSRRGIPRVCQPRPGHSLRGRVGLQPPLRRPGQIVSSTKGDISHATLQVTSFLLPHRADARALQGPHSLE